MPSRIPTPCRTCGKPIAKPGWCKTCRPRRRVALKQRYPWWNYGRDWQRIRAAVLAETPLCQCEGCGPKCCARRAEATQVDHVVPQQDGGTHARENLKALCAPCHGRKTRRETEARSR